MTQGFIKLCKQIKGRANKKSLMTPLVFFSFLFCLFRATPAAYGGSQARGQTGAVAAGLHHSHSNARSEPCLRPYHSSQQRQILNPLNEARDRTCVFIDAIQIHLL